MQILEKRIYFQYSLKQRLLLYSVVSTFVGLVAFVIANFNPTVMFVKLMVTGSYALSFGLATIIVSELRIALLVWNKKSDFNGSYIDLWLVGAILFILGFFLLGGIQVIVGSLKIPETDFYYNPENGFLPFTWQFLKKMIVPCAMIILVVGHVFLKKIKTIQRITIEQEEKPITIEAGKKSVTLNPDNITHISIIQHYATFFLNTIEGIEEVELKSSLVNILKQLPPDRFIKVHRSHLVNLAYVEKINSLSGEANVVLKNRTDQVPVSRRQLRELKEAHESYLEQIRKVATPVR